MNDVRPQYNMKQYPFSKFRMLLYMDAGFHFQSYFLAEFQPIIWFELENKYYFE